MRRKDREVKEFDDIRNIIDECEVIRIGLCDDDMHPYIVPMNFGYTIEDEQIYFYLHGAMAGRKYELMKKNGVCSFEMDCGYQIVLLEQSKQVTMRYKSVMGKAKIEFLEDADKVKGLDIIMDRYEATRGFEYHPAMVAHTAVMKLTVTEYSGKINNTKGDNHHEEV